MKKSRVLLIITLFISVFFINTSIAKAESLQEQYLSEKNSCVAECGKSINTNTINSCVESCGKEYDNKIQNLPKTLKQQQFQKEYDSCDSQCRKTSNAATINDCLKVCKNELDFKNNNISKILEFDKEFTECQKNCGENASNSCLESCGKYYENNINSIREKSGSNSSGGNSSSGEDEIQIPTELCAEGSRTLYVFQVAVYFIRFLQIAIPFALIIWGSIDFFKAMIAGDEKAMRDKRKPFISRLVAAVLVVLLPMFVNLILHTIAKDSESTGEFVYCWVQATEQTKIVIPGLDD